MLVFNADKLDLLRIKMLDLKMLKSLTAINRLLIFLLIINFVSRWEKHFLIFTITNKNLLKKEKW
jgi:hypothetical protein